LWNGKRGRVKHEWQMGVNFALYEVLRYNLCMATTAQLQDLSRFIATLPSGERNALSIDEIYERWREQAFRQDDLLAIQASVRDFENGERGRPIEEFLADFDKERLKIKPSSGS